MNDFAVYNFYCYLFLTLAQYILYIEVSNLRVSARNNKLSLGMNFVKANAVDGKPDALAFSITNARKDVGYYATMADDLGVPSVMSVAAKQALGIAKATGHGDNMVPQMVDFFAELFKDR